MRTFTFNGINCSTYGIAISGEGTYNAPARNQTIINIPGRNGDLIMDDGSYKNITLKYPAFFIGDFQTYAAAAREWLLGQTAYCRLTDDYHTDEYRLGIYSGGLSFKPTAWNLHADFDISFNCKPQRFLTSGESDTVMTNGGTITNPTGFVALPLITVTCTGDGTISVGGTTVTLTDLTGGIVLDCDLLDAYYGSLSANDLMSGDFPTLGPGVNGVSWTGDVTGVTIKPRWWRL